MATYLTRTPASAGNRKTFTISAWFKKNPLVVQNIMYSNVSQESVYQFTSTGQINYYEYSGGYTSRLLTNAVYTDGSAWYNVVLAVDTTQATSSNRLKMYVNGEQVTSFSAATYPSQNFESYNINNNSLQTIGANNGNDGFSGSMSHFNFIDGTAYDASAFGSTDATTGEWKINTSPSVTYGTNGFFILKDGNSVTDQSGQSNNLTVGGGTLTKTEDCPSNVFATLNPLASLPNTGVSTFTNGNTTSQGVNGSYVNGGSNLQMSSGKWYAECKYIATSSDVGRMIIGITQDVSEISRINQDTVSYNTYLNNYDGAGAKSVQGSNPSSYGNAYGVNDIIGIALDLDNEKLYFSINGTWQNSGVPTSGSTGTGAITGFSSPSSSISGGYFFFSGSNSNAQNNTVSWNFGNGYFGTTAVSSAGTNASGNGIFEYDCPAGFTALSTKGLNL